MRAVSLALVLFFMLALPLTAAACDWAPPEPGPRLQVDTGLVVDAVDIHISCQKISVTYNIRNATGDEVKLPLLFYAPPYRWPGFGDEDPRGAFDSMRVFVNGQPAPLTLSHTALLEGKNITAFLQAKKIDIGYTSLNEFSKKHETTIVQDPELNPDSKHNGGKGGNAYFDVCAGCNPQQVYYGPNWTVVPRYTLSQSFPPNSVTTLRQEYKPFPGFTHGGTKSSPVYTTLLSNDFFKKYPPPADAGEEDNYYNYAHGSVAFNGFASVQPGTVLTATVDTADCTDGYTITGLSLKNAASLTNATWLGEKSLSVRVDDMSRHENELFYCMVKVWEQAEK